MTTYKCVVNLRQRSQSPTVWQEYFSFTEDVFANLQNNFEFTRTNFCDFFQDCNYILVQHGYWYKERFNKETGEWDHSLKHTKIEQNNLVEYSEIKGRENILNTLTTLDCLKKHFQKNVLEKEDIETSLVTFATVRSVRIDFNVKLENVKLYLEYYTCDEWKTIYHIGTCSISSVDGFDRASKLSRYLTNIIVGLLMAKDCKH
jgi:hypothetical protein